MKFAIGLSVLLVGFSIFYYLVIFLPQQNQQKLNSETVKIIKEASNQAELESCLDEVSQRTSKAFTNTKEAGSISNDGAKIIVEVIKQQREECYKKYPQK